MSSFRFGQAEIASKDFHKDRQVTDQPVITTRIYVLLIFQFPRRNCKPQASHNVQRGSTRLGSG